MAITRLERKGRKNKTVSKQRTSAIKRLSAKPVVKNVDVEAIKAEFENTANAKKEPVKRAEKVEVKAEAKEKVEVKEVKAEAVEKKETKKKAPAKKKEKE